MAQWHQLNLGSGADTLKLSFDIQQAFLGLFAARGGPADMAILFRRENQETTLYFSPAAAPIATMFHAAECGKPAREGLGLEVGDARCWSDLFE